MRPYIDPHDHAFANGPVFLRPASAEAARALFDRAEDGDRLLELFDAFHRGAEIGEGLRLGLGARLVTPDGSPRVKIGRDCAIRGVIRCEDDGRAVLGERVYLGDDAIISIRSKVEIGDGVLIAHGVQIFDNDTHPVDHADREAHFRAILKIGPHRSFRIAAKPVRIGRACWIGFGAAVLKGVSIGEGSIVAAGSVVTGDVPEQVVVAGNPARIVKVLDRSRKGRVLARIGAAVRALRR